MSVGDFFLLQWARKGQAALSSAAGCFVSGSSHTMNASEERVAATQSVVVIYSFK